MIATSSPKQIRCTAHINHKWILSNYYMGIQYSTITPSQPPHQMAMIGVSKNRTFFYKTNQGWIRHFSIDWTQRYSNLNAVDAYWFLLYLTYIMRHQGFNGIINSVFTRSTPSRWPNFCFLLLNKNSPVIHSIKQTKYSMFFITHTPSVHLDFELASNENAHILMLSETATLTVLSKLSQQTVSYLSSYSVDHFKTELYSSSSLMQCIIFVKPFLTSFIQTTMTHLLS